MIGHIYAIKYEGLDRYKIGKTSKTLQYLKKRYKTYHPFVDVVLYIESHNIDKHEKEIHNILSEYRVNNTEWFDTNFSNINFAFNKCFSTSSSSIHTIDCPSYTGSSSKLFEHYISINNYLYQHDHNNIHNHPQHPQHHNIHNHQHHNTHNHPQHPQHHNIHNHQHHNNIHNHPQHPQHHNIHNHPQHPHHHNIHNHKDHNNIHNHKDHHNIHNHKDHHNEYRCQQNNIYQNNYHNRNHNLGRNNCCNCKVFVSYEYMNKHNNTIYCNNCTRYSRNCIKY